MKTDYNYILGFKGRLSDRVATVALFKTYEDAYDFKTLKDELEPTLEWVIKDINTGKDVKERIMRRIKKKIIIIAKKITKINGN